jgi:hypothetical protein
VHRAIERAEPHPTRPVDQQHGGYATRRLSSPSNNTSATTQRRNPLHASPADSLAAGARARDPAAPPPRSPPRPADHWYGAAFEEFAAMEASSWDALRKQVKTPAPSRIPSLSRSPYILPLPVSFRRRSGSASHLRGGGGRGLRYSYIRFSSPFAR